MAKFDTTALKKIRKLYQVHLGQTPNMINETTSISAEHFRSNAIPSISLLIRDFNPHLCSIAQNIAQGFLNNYTFETLLHLVLAEYLLWSTQTDRMGKMQEFVIINQRITLFKAIFLSEENTLKINDIYKGKLHFFLKKIEENLTLQTRQIDVHDVGDSLVKIASTLSSKIVDFRAKPLSFSEPKLENFLRGDFDKAVRDFITSLNDLDRLFWELKNQGGRLQRSEQDRQNIAVKIGHIFCQRDTLSNTLQNILNYSTATNTVKTVASHIENDLSTIANHLKLIQWHVGTDEGRFYNLNKLAHLMSPELDLHIVQNPLSEEMKKQVEESFNPSWTPPRPSM